MDSRHAGTSTTRLRASGKQEFVRHTFDPNVGRSKLNNFVLSGLSDMHRLLHSSGDTPDEPVPHDEKRVGLTRILLPSLSFNGARSSAYDCEASPWRGDGAHGQKHCFVDR